MNLPAMAAALLAAGAVVTSFPGPGRLELPVSGPAGVEGEDAGLLRRLRPVLVALALLGCWAFFGGPVGALLGIAAGAWAWRVIGSTEGPVAKRRRTELENDLPLAVHLLGETLRAGSAIGTGLRTVGASLPGAVATEFAIIAARLDLGADPVSVWTSVAAGGPLAPLGAALARAHQSGASVTAVVDRLCADLRSEVRSRTEARARTVEVRAAAPLGLCLLPSFMLLGVVPMTVGLFSSLDFLR